MQPEDAKGTKDKVLATPPAKHKANSGAGGNDDHARAGRKQMLVF